MSQANVRSKGSRFWYIFWEFSCFHLTIFEIPFYDISSYSFLRITLYSPFYNYMIKLDKMTTIISSMTCINSNYDYT